MTFQIDKAGMVTDARVKNSRSAAIERGAMKSVSGIVIHQTDSDTVKATLNGYKLAKANGAHFLIDADGTLHQTASVYQKTNHVGKLQSRCLAEATCKPADYPKKDLVNAMNKIELAKAIPARYPSNGDAIGIEMVGRAALPNNFVPPRHRASWTTEQLRGEYGVYPVPTSQQITSLKWLVDGLISSLNISSNEIFAHPVVSWKNPTEAKGTVETLRVLWSVDMMLRALGVVVP